MAVQSDKRKVAQIAK